MRLFEVDQGSAREVLAVLQGLVNRADQKSEIPFPTIMHILKPFALGISTPDGLIALKNDVDPAGDVIKDVLDNGTVILKTASDKNDQDRPLDQGTGPSLDSMASRGAKKLTPDI